MHSRVLLLLATSATGAVVQSPNESKHRNLPRVYPVGADGSFGKIGVDAGGYSARSQSSWTFTPAAATSSFFPGMMATATGIGLPTGPPGSSAAATPVGGIPQYPHIPGTPDPQAPPFAAATDSPFMTHEHGMGHTPPWHGKIHTEGTSDPFALLDFGGFGASPAGMMAGWPGKNLSMLDDSLKGRCAPDITISEIASEMGDQNKPLNMCLPPVKNPHSFLPCPCTDQTSGCQTASDKCFFRPGKHWCSCCPANANTTRDCADAAFKIAQHQAATAAGRLATAEKEMKANDDFMVGGGGPGAVAMGGPGSIIGGDLIAGAAAMAPSILTASFGPVVGDGGVSGDSSLVSGIAGLPGPPPPGSPPPASPPPASASGASLSKASKEEAVPPRGGLSGALGRDYGPGMID